MLPLSFLLFPERKPTVLFSFAEEIDTQNLGEADPGALGACPQKTVLINASG
jgi:hypothetical protein